LTGFRLPAEQGPTNGAAERRLDVEEPAAEHRRDLFIIVVLCWRGGSKARTSLPLMKMLSFWRLMMLISMEQALIVINPSDVPPWEEPPGWRR
jgi:hypothetical protein